MPFHWNPDPIIAELGSIELRWYGVCFAIGILWGATMLPRYYQQRGFSEDHANSLSIWIPLCMIIGAHAVHIIFYDTEVLVRFWRTPDWDHFRAHPRRAFWSGQPRGRASAASSRCGPTRAARS
jgi:prolipoprotein diacylglyceryltransferase